MRRLRNVALKEFHRESVSGKFQPRVVPSKKEKKLTKVLEKELANDN